MTDDAKRRWDSERAELSSKLILRNTETWQQGFSHSEKDSPSEIVDTLVTKSWYNVYRGLLYKKIRL